MNFTKISEIIQHRIPAEWYGTYEDGIVEETVTYEDGTTLEMRLEITDEEDEETFEDEIDESLYVMVGSKESPQLIHRDLLDVYLEEFSPCEEPEDATKLWTESMKNVNK